jgi:hypothetical protein
MPIPKCRPAGVRAEKETLDEKQEILTSPFETRLRRVKETAKRDATPDHRGEKVRSITTP